MKSLTLISLLSIALCSFGQEKDCSKFRDGKFKIVDKKIGDSFIERKGSKQTEYAERSGLKLEFEVTWKNECTYTLTLMKVLENPKNFEFPEGIILTIEIIETKENSYIQKTSSNLYDLVLESELFKLD